MRLDNTSLYPTARVRELVEFAMKGVNTDRLYVRVKGSNGTVAGAAYDNVPDVSPVSRMKSVDRLVVCRIGSPSSFPCDNLREYTRWVQVPLSQWQEMSKAEQEKLRYWQHSDGSFGQERQVVMKHPYGGQRSPLIVMNDWEEGLIALAAHEGRHVHQQRNGKPRSEVDAERFAAKRLEAWRALAQ
jgi:hypothetical protein